MAEIKLTAQNFKTEVMDSDVPVLVDFWATWCGPCRMLAPVIEEISREYDGKIKVGKVNTDEEQVLAMKYGINAIPTVILFKDGKIAGQSVGYAPKDSFVKMINASL